MKFSRKAQQCYLSPIRKFYPYTLAATRAGKKIYYLNIGQPDIATPKEFFDAVNKFTDPVLAYAPSPGIPNMIEAVQNYYRRIGVEYDTGDIIITLGGSEALQATLLSILDDGDEVLVAEPFYPNYHTFVTAAGGRIKPIPTKAEEGFHYAERNKIEAAITDRTKALIISNPGNPTGTVLTPDEMAMIADLVHERGLFLIADEVYREFVYNGEELATMGKFDHIADNLIIIDSVSKRFSACGARIGNAITKNKELQQHILKFCQARLSAPSLDQIGSAALYGLDPSYFDEIREEYKRRRDLVLGRLNAMEGVICGKPGGAFYITCKLPVDNAEDFLIWMLTEFDGKGETILFAPAEGFYATPGKGKNEVRLAYVLNLSDLDRAMDVLELGLKEYNRR